MTHTIDRMPKPFRFSVSLGGLDTAEVSAAARRAEELGYAAATMPDHFTAQAAPLIALTAAALSTTRLRVLPLVLANDFRNPLMAAKELATLDVLSAGRVEFGLGAGWMIEDYERSGVAHDSAGTRIARLAEAVDIITALLAGEDASGLQQQFYAVSGRLAGPMPVQPEGVPLMLAGGKQKMLTLAGEKADIVGVNLALSAGVIDERVGQGATAAATDTKLDWIKDGAGDRFDDLELQTRVHLAAITDDREAAATRLGARLGLAGADAIASPHVLIGTLRECADSLRRARDRWGVSFVSINGEVMDDFAPVVELLAGT